MAQPSQDKKDHYEETSHVRFSGPIGGLLTFNADYGYLEGLLRGFRSGFLKDNELKHLCQCSSLEDVKLAFQDTDYLTVLSNVTQLTPDVIAERCWDKTVQEFHFLREQATGPLASFLDFITYDFLVENITLIITGLIRGGSDPNALLEKCNRLGAFPRLKSTLGFENSGDGLLELYRTVLIDTPVGKYFEAYFNKSLKPEDASQPYNVIQQEYNEKALDIINNTLIRMWLEDFYEYTQSLGGETASVMKTLLEFEADRRAIEITLNSFGTSLNDPANRQERKELYCTFGQLYPQGIQALAEVSDVNGLTEVVSKYDTFRRLMDQGNSEGKDLQDMLKVMEVKLNRDAFDGQSHFAAFYAFLKLKIQEKKNIWWICSCIYEKRDQKDFNRWIKIF